MSQLFQIPRALNWLEKSESGREWLVQLPSRVDRCREKWGLQLESPYQQSFVSIVFPAELSDGRPAVLKIQWPHRESAHEHEALQLWNGNGAVRLYAYDSGEHALLLERCEPGEHLSTIPEEQALEVFIGMLPRLWIPAGQPFRGLAEECLEWQSRLPAEWVLAGRPSSARCSTWRLRLWTVFQERGACKSCSITIYMGIMSCVLVANHGWRLIQSLWSAKRNSRWRLSYAATSSATAAWMSSADWTT